MQRIAAALFSILFISACGNQSGSSATQSPEARISSLSEAQRCASVQHLSFQPSQTITRSARGLTEGFALIEGRLFESTGLISGHGASVLNSIDPATGNVTQLSPTPNSSFGEGLIKVGGYFYQLTYQDGNIYKYSGDGTQLIGTYPNPLNEGWGLTTDGTDLIASDGSNAVYRIDPNSLKIKSKISVTSSSGAAINGLNELEYVDGQIYANIFPTKRMVRFDATYGCQTGEIDLSNLSSSFNCPGSALECDSNSVTNGIAYDASSGDFYLTGKSWPVIYKGRFQ